MRYLLKINFIIRLGEASLKFGLTPLTVGWHGPKKRGQFSNRRLTSDLGGDWAAIPHQQLEFPLVRPAPVPSSSKSPLEGNGSEEFLTAVVPREGKHCSVIAYSRKSYQNEFVPVSSFLKGLSCLFDLTLSITPGKRECLSPESHMEDGQGSTVTMTLLIACHETCITQGPPSEFTPSLGGEWTCQWESVCVCTCACSI